MSVKYGKEKCRFCLNIIQEYLNIYEGNYEVLVQELVGIEISEDDGLPKTACISCIHELEIATKVKMRILNCQSKLELIHEEQILKELYENKPLDNCTGKTSLNEEKINLTTLNLNNSNVKILDDVHVKRKIQSDDDDFISNGCSVTLDSNNSNNESELSCEPSDESKVSEKFDDSTTLVENDSMKKKSELHQSKSELCHFCGIILKNAICLKNHVNANHKPFCFKCEYCPSIFRRKYHLQVHVMRRHVPKKKNISDLPPKCEMCDKTFRSRHGLRLHKAFVHKLWDVPFKCDQCPKSFKDKKNLKKHQIHDHKGKPTACHICGKQFACLWDTQRHIKMKHMKKYSYQCEYCKKGFTSEYFLNVHSLIHKNETPFKCSVCPEGFWHNRQLREHLKSKHAIDQEYDYSCKFCKKVYSTDFALKLHLRQLHTGKFFECSECEQYFEEGILLSNHLRNDHGVIESKMENSIRIENTITIEASDHIDDD